MAAIALRIDPGDNVAVVFEDVKKGQWVESTGSMKLEALTDIPRNHKIALFELKRGAHVIRYGQPIGVASEDIPRGAWIHTHNLKSEES